MSHYREIARHLARRISEGEFAIGTRLPSEQALVGEYSVARGTVRNALKLVAKSGSVAPRHGSGWIVQSTLQHHSLSHLRSFAQWANSKGFEPSGSVVATRYELTTAQETRRLHLDVPARVLRVIRARSLDGRLVMLERTSYAPWVAPMIESLSTTEVSVVLALEKRFGVITAYGEHTVDAVAASTEDALLLDVRRSSPLLRVRRESFAKDGRIIEFADDRYLPGTIAFQAHTSIETGSLGRTLA